MNSVREKNMAKIYPLSECSISIEFGNEISLSLHQKVIACRELIMRDPFDGLIEVVATYSTVTVLYDPVIVSRYASPLTPHKRVRSTLEKIITQLEENVRPHVSEVISIPVCYDEEFAPDLQEVADLHHTGKEDIQRKHTETEYTVFMIGFMPGFPYMGILPADLESPRKQTPRTLVPSGSVGIAGRQTGIYPFDSPGGWQIIGRTPLKLFLPDAKRHSLLGAGDRVRFVSISKDEYKQLSVK
jgi:inhibitor of KinA